MANYDDIKKRQFFKQFIKLYEGFPCLWNVNSMPYHDRELRTRAYSVLVKKLQEYDPNSDRSAVVKKINCFRSNYRKELRKIREGLKRGRVIKPKLWYFHYFDFLDEISRPGDKLQASSGMNAENVKLQNAANVEIMLEKSTFVPSEGNIKEELAYQEDDQPQDMDAEQSWEPSNEDDPSPLQPIANTNSELVVESTTTPVTPDVDKCDVFGINVAMKLRHIASKSDAQRIMAEMIINEALSMAEMGLLTMEHCRVNK